MVLPSRGRRCCPLAENGSRNQIARSAFGTGRRAARIANGIVPIRPMTMTQTKLIVATRGDTNSRKMSYPVAVYKPVEQ